MASYNHPFGYGALPPKSVSVQDSLVTSTASTLLGKNLLGCDILEVGYPLRNGVDLTHHAALWDVLSANCRFTTANGVSDDHYGTDWAGQRNNWTTSVWAPSRSMSDLIDALRAGRAWTSSLSRFSGFLDLTADGTCPMGSVSLSGATTRQVRVIGHRYTRQRQRGRASWRCRLPWGSQRPSRGGSQYFCRRPDWWRFNTQYRHSY